jgi:hypothetical protein
VPASTRSVRSPRDISESPERSCLSTSEYPLPGTDRPLDEHGRCELLTIGRQLVDFAHNIHASNKAAERGKSLAVRITFAAKVQFRLIADADEKLISCGVGFFTGHRDGPVHVPQTRVASPLQRNRREEVFLTGRVRRRLDYLDLHVVGRLVSQRDRPVKGTVRVETLQRVAEEILVCDGSFSDTTVWRIS